MVSRREFLKTAAAAIMGGALLPVLGRLEIAEGEAEKEYELPWPYAELDVLETLKRGHLGYYVYECAGGAFWALASQLREKIGGIWAILPVPSLDTVRNAVLQKKHLMGLMQYGAGGVVSWASLCGALNGAIFIIQVVTGLKELYEEFGRWLLRYYEVAPFPSELVNQLAERGELYVPKSKMKYPGVLPKSVSHSVLCHVSVSRWCMVSGFASGSKERSERCGRLTGDTAAAAAVILNAFWEVAREMGLVEGNRFMAHEASGKESTIVERVKAKISQWASRSDATGFYARRVMLGFKLSATTASCRTCHYKGKDYEMGQFTRGYMQCEACHRDMTPHAHYMIQVPQTLSHHEAEVREFNSTAPIFTGLMGAIAGVVAGAALARKSREEK